MKRVHVVLSVAISLLWMWVASLFQVGPIAILGVGVVVYLLAQLVFGLCVVSANADDRTGTR